jgi:nitrilase
VEKLFVASIDYRKVLEERQNFDPSGHYSRPDVTRLEVNRKRQSVVGLAD